MQFTVIDMRSFWYVDGHKIFILSCTCMLMYFSLQISSDSYKINATTTYAHGISTITIFNLITFYKMCVK